MVVLRPWVYERAHNKKIVAPQIGLPLQHMRWANVCIFSNFIIKKSEKSQLFYNNVVP